MKSFHRLLFPALLALLVPLAHASAQGLSIAGIVVSKENDEALPGANVVIKGTTYGTTTDLQGKFSIQLEDQTEATVVVSYIGYRSTEVKVTESTANLEIELKEDLLKGEEVVIVGLASSVKRQNLANTVATVSSVELLGSPTQTVDAALSGKFSGVTVSQNTGAPGGGISVNLRGVSTIEGKSQPLYVVDGVLINNDAIQSGIDLVTAATGAGSASPQGQPTNRVADINPHDIDNIEVLKGASAAAIYGSKASNGVVLITTKRGGIGRTRFNVTQQVGFSSLLHKIGTRRFTDSASVIDQYGQQGLDILRQTGFRYIDYEKEMYGEKGFLRSTDISATGGNEKTQYFISGFLQSDEGIIKGTNYDKNAVKLNITHKFSDRISLNLSSNYIRSVSNRGITGNDNTNTTFGFALAFTPSFYDIRDVNGEYADNIFNPSNPLQTRDLLTNEETVNRTINALRFSYHLWQTKEHDLDFVVQAGFDYFSQSNKIFAPPELQFQKNAALPGQSLNGETSSLNTNYYYNLVHLYQFRPEVSFKTSAGLQFENTHIDNTLVDAQGLVHDNVGRGGSVDVYETIAKTRNRGLFLQEEVNLQERIYLTAGARGDASSTNGDTKKYFWYPKASASVRLSKYAFWEPLTSYVSEFKARLAYGQTGNLAPADSKFLTFTSSNIGGGVGSISPPRLNNPDIKPERTKELEGGFDATFWNERGSFEFTYYNQKISDLILLRPIPGSAGNQEQFFNGGSMTTKGLEMSIVLTPIRTRDFSWTSRTSYYHTSSEIDKLKVLNFNKGGFATFLGTYRIEEGLSPTTIIGAETDYTVVDSATGNEKIVRGTEIGNETPDFQMSFSNAFNYKNWELRLLWDWKNGGDVINLGKLITDLGGTTKDDPANIAKRLDSLGVRTSYYVEDGSYWKLREVSLTYTFPRSMVASMFAGKVSYMKMGIAGRNLILITKYDGYDPEVSQFGSVAIGRSVDTIPFPSSRSFYFTVSFGF